MSAPVFNAARAVVNGGRDFHVGIAIALGYVALFLLAITGSLE